MRRFMVFCIVPDFLQRPAGAVAAFCTTLVAIAIATAQPAAAAVPRGGPDVSLAYFGETIAHPVLAGGPKFSLVDRRWFDLTLGPVLGLYVHPRNHTGLFLDAELESRFTTPVGFFLSVGAAVGYIRTWLGGDAVYERDQAGGVREGADWGRSHLKVGMSFGLGWDFANNDLWPLRAFVRLDAFGRTPVNNAFLPQLALQVGAVWRFGGVR